LAELNEEMVYSPLGSERLTGALLDRLTHHDQNQTLAGPLRTKSVNDMRGAKEIIASGRLSRSGKFPSLTTARNTVT
jgi:hypothetical protein